MNQIIAGCKIRVSLSLVLVGVVLLLFSSCTRNIAPPDDALTTPQELRVAIDARLSGVQDARFREVVLEYFGDGERVRVRQVILVQRPASLRVQTRLPGSDELLNVLVSNSEVFSMHQRDTHEYVTGAPTKENINRLLPVDLSGPDVVRVMLGGAPWDRFEESGAEPRLRWDRRGGMYHYSVERENGNELFMLVRHTDFAVVEVQEVDRDGNQLYAYTTRQWRNLGAIALPNYRRFYWPDRDLDFSLDVGDTQLNNDLAPQLFELPPPPGSRIIELDQ